MIMSYDILKDGKRLVTVRKESDAYYWLLKHQPMSVSHATRHEGYKIRKSKRRHKIKKRKRRKW